MRKQSGTFKSGALPRLSMVTFIAGLLPALVLLFSLRPAYAGSATWNLNPTSGDWNTAGNWMPNTVPNSPTDVATFNVSNTTDISLSSSVTVDSIVFNPGASAYNITLATGSANAGLTITGAGIVN